MRLRKLRKSEWHDYCRRFSKGLAGSRSDIVVTVSLAVNQEVAAEWVPLLGVTYEPKNDLFEITLQDLDHRIRRPQTFYVDEGPNGTAGVEIIDSANLRHALQLSYPIKVTSTAME